MKTLARQLSLLIILSLFVIPWAFAQGEEPLTPPAVIELNGLANYYLGVSFDHEMHMDAYSCVACHHISSDPDSAAESTCAKCHASQAGAAITTCRSCHREQYLVSPTDRPVVDEHQPSNFHIDTPQLKGAYHLQCLGCHIREGVPAGCTDCHLLSTAGKQLFLVND